MSYVNGEISYWMYSQSPTVHSEPLPEAKQDLAIVGGGLTGLWSAYYAKKANPDWKVTVVEAKQVGYSASGRNGGWLSTFMPGNRAVYAKKATVGNGLESVREFQQTVNRGIYEALDVMAKEGIDADQHQGGILFIARNRPGVKRIEEHRELDIKYGYKPDEVSMLNADEARKRINVEGTLGALHFKHTAAINPGKLVLGLADVLRNMGVTICEYSPAEHVAKNVVVTSRGPVVAERIFVCAEAYTGEISGDVRGLGKRELIPVNSSIITTEPLSDRDWDRIGWDDRDCLYDSDHQFIYAQRTVDGRIVIGGRGAPYFYNSRTAGRGAVDKRTVKTLHRKLQDFFPYVNLEIAHAWRGSIGVTRDWCAGVFWDKEKQIGVARGYAGHGVTSTNLAARTMLDLASGEETPLTRLPWVDYRSPQWEVEPIRWLGVHSMYKLFEIADAWEYKTNRNNTSLLARFGSRLAGLHE